MDKSKRIGVLMGGVSREREVSLRTGQAALNALQSLGYQAQAIDVGRDFLEKVKTLEIDIAFIALHGSFGEDGRIQSLLDWAGIPYTGSGVLTSALSFQKDALKNFLHSFHVPMAKGITYRTSAANPTLDEIEKWIGGRSFDYPLIAKPTSEGSSIGVTRVFTATELPAAILTALGEASPFPGQATRAALIEEYVEGRELTVSVLNGKALPLLEIRAAEGFYDYRAKYQSKTTLYEFPEDLAEPLIASIAKESERIYAEIGAKGAIRIDWILSCKTGEPIFLEVNTIPGMTETSLLPKAAKRAGLSFPQLVESILNAVET